MKRWGGRGGRGKGVFFWDVCRAWIVCVSECECVGEWIMVCFKVRRLVIVFCCFFIG